LYHQSVDYTYPYSLVLSQNNPAKEDVEFIESIKNDVKWLGFEWDGEIQYSSNYFTKFYKYAIELINKELAYVCFLKIDSINSTSSLAGFVSSKRRLHLPL
jgi:glutaminyl-tRNA synthetase